MQNLSPLVKRSVWLVLILLNVVGILVYANGLNGAFVWDDHELIVENPYIKTWRGLPHLFTQDIASGAGERFYYYRPLQMVTYLMNMTISGLQPFAFRLTNVLLHGIASWLVFLLLREITRDALTSFLAALFFVVHPIHVGAITYISGRADSLVALWVFLSLFAFLRLAGLPPGASGTWRWRTLGYVSFALALLTRENALMMPVYLLLCRWILSRPLPRWDWVGIVGTIVGYALLRQWLFPQLVLPWSLADWPPRLPGFFDAVSRYVQLLIIPHPLRVDYGVVYFSFHELRPWIGLAMFGLGVGSSIILRRSHPLIALAFAWFFVGLLPVSNIYPLNSYMAEHWLYLPSVGFFMLAALLLRKGVEIRSRFPWVLAIFLVTLIGWGTKTMWQNRIWRDPITFYTYMIGHAPGSIMLHNRLGMEWLQRGRVEEAERTFRWIERMDPEFAPVLHNLGFIHEMKGEEATALSYYEKALALNAQQEKTWINVAKLRARLGQAEAAVHAADQALALNPAFLPAHVGKAEVFLHLGKEQEALSLLERVLSIDPQRKDALHLLADTNHALNRPQAALDAHIRLLAIDPADHLAINRVGNYYLAHGDLDKALAMFEEGIRLHPHHAPYYNNIGVILSRQTRFSEARGYFLTALQLDPHLMEAQKNLKAAETMIE